MPPSTWSRRTRHAASWIRAARIAPARFRLGRCWRHREPDAEDPRLAGRRFMARQAMITVRHAPADNDGETIAHKVESHPALAEQHLPVAAENDAAPVSPLATVWTPRRRRGTERPATLASADRFAGAPLMPREHSLRKVARRRPSLGPQELSCLKPIQRQSSLPRAVTATPVWQGASRLRDSSGGKARLHAFPGIPALPAGPSNCSLAGPSRSPCG